ncbi:MAG: dTDP-4-dehydrorhamnose 3,5-epimerase [Flavobacteriaceae bacterium]|jgi:dTDP-4-dehydrorhamnose 3,5-epimerase|nr:dTDP-4-dehydrorhamnose 3,5-epimerase [Flavobacteriaceae bacterium]
MKITETRLKGCFLIEPKLWQDERGYFFESYHQGKFQEETGVEIKFVQDNESKSKYGVVRGLHMQRGSFAQSKMVRVLKGSILDVAVDVRKDSPTFGAHFSIELNEENKKQLFIPAGFLHGFSVLSEEAIVYYKCDAFYDKDSEDGVNPLDSDLNIDWQIPRERMILSEKDEKAQSFKELIPVS